jgi:NAD(P)-dependent dehydrogenase (short-subunit alcohol dehydrogenase family)
MISPAAPVETDMVRSDLRITQDRIQVGRFGRPEEVAEVAVTLACSGYFAGRSINIMRVGPGWGKLPRLSEIRPDLVGQLSNCTDMASHTATRVFCLEES